MRRADYPQAFGQAATPVLATIERDGQRAPKQLKPLFAAMCDLIFEPDLELYRITMTADFDDESGQELLRDELGQSAWSYLRDARLETAARLLLETPMSLLDIGRMVGYSSPSSFRRILRDFLGMSASQYRRRAPRILERGGPAPEGSDTDEYWERMAAGELSGDEARALDTYLGRLAPDSTATAEPDAEAERWTRLRETLADGFVSALDNLVSFADQRRLARDAVAFPDTTLFERLSRQSREVAAGRARIRESADRLERAVEWALLAIDSLAANRMLETYPELTTLAWARLALARWRAGDLGGAEKDLSQSAHDFERTGKDPFPAAWQAERGRVVVAFHWHQGRRRAALRLVDDTVAAHRAAWSEALCQALMLRAELRAASADLGLSGEIRAEALSQALADVEEAHELRTPAPAPERVAILSLWVRILVLTGDRAEMSGALPQVRQWADSLGDAAAPHLLWLEGHLDAVAEPDAGLERKAAQWHRARQRFAALDDELGAAQTTLDLTRLHLLEDQTKEAAALASELAAQLGAVVTIPADLAAIKTLSHAATPAGTLAESALDRVAPVLERLVWERRASRALELAL